MEWNTLRMPHKYHITSHLHYFSFIFFVLPVSLVCCTICFAYSFFALLPVAHSKTIPLTVQIDGSAQPPGFSPALLTFHINETVVFINHALPASSYTLKADDGSFSSPPIPTGGQWSLTFHTPGSHTYRASSSTQTIAGELLVVDKNVQLLSTPDPLVEATVTALIKNGQNPPDTIIIVAHKPPTPAANSLLPMIILVIGVSISLTLLAVLGFTYYKRQRQRVATTNENEDASDLDEDIATHSPIQHIRPIIDNVKQKVTGYWQSLKNKINKNKDEDDDEDDDEDEDEKDEDDEDDDDA
jgi:plastocyanin